MHAVHTHTHTHTHVSFSNTHTHTAFLSHIAPTVFFLFSLVLSNTQELLTACGRGHDLAEAEAAIAAVHAAGLASWSLDLISGLPGLTPDMWAASLERAVAAGPDHVSVYDLQVTHVWRLSGCGFGCDLGGLVDGWSAGG